MVDGLWNATRAHMAAAGLADRSWVFPSPVVTPAWSNSLHDKHAGYLFMAAAGLADRPPAALRRHLTPAGEWNRDMYYTNFEVCICI